MSKKQKKALSKKDKALLKKTLAEVAVRMSVSLLPADFPHFIQTYKEALKMINRD